MPQPCRGLDAAIDALGLVMRTHHEQARDADGMARPASRMPARPLGEGRSSLSEVLGGETPAESRSGAATSAVIDEAAS